MEKVIYRSEFNKMLKKDFIREIPNLENYYVSKNGDILSALYYMSTGKVKKLSTFITDLGYYQIVINKVGYRVHRLVALAFIPNPNNYPIINHKDENPSNNHVDNLEWCTYQYNSNYGTCNQRKSKRVAQIDKFGNTVKIWNSIWEATRNGFVRSLVSDCANGKISTYRKFKWEFV